MLANFCVAAIVIGAGCPHLRLGVLRANFCVEATGKRSYDECTSIGFSFYQQRKEFTMNTKVFTVATLLFLILGLGGCDQIIPLIPTEPEANDFVGVWTIHSVDGQPFDATQGQPLADSFSVWTFSHDGQFELILGWTPAPNEQGVFDVPQFYFRIAGTYALTGSKFSLTAGQSIGFFDTVGR